MDNARTYPPRHTLPADLADELRQARLRRGLGLREAARRARVDPGHLCRIEQGKRCPSVDVARQLIAALKPTAELATRLLEVARPDAGRSHPRQQSAA